jgi:hypothetical protein
MDEINAMPVTGAPEEEKVVEGVEAAPEETAPEGEIEPVV